MDGYTLKRMARRPWLCLLSFIASGALCLLLCLLSNYREGQQRQLDEVKNSYELVAVVTDARGTKAENLRLSHRYTDFLQDKENGLGAYIDDLRLTKTFTYAGPFGAGDLIGVTNERCSDALNPDAGGAWYAEDADFFAGTERVCLVSELFYAAYAGQEILLDVTDPYGSFSMNQGRGQVPLTVAGWYKGADTAIYIPYPLSQQLAAQLSESASTDTASFTLKDNGKLDEMLLASAAMFTQADPSTASGGFALSVHDRQYKATLAAMEQNIRRTGYLLPLIGLLGLGAGFLIGFLTTRGEARIYALMRTLGMTGAKLLLTILLEQLLLPLIACAIVGFALSGPLPAAAFFGCHAIGCCLATLRPVLAPPTHLLRVRE